MTPITKDDDLTVSNSPSVISAPTATPPQPSPTAGAPDNQAGAPQTPPQTSQQPTSASDSPNGPTSLSNAQTPAVGAPTANPSNALASHPVVQKAGVVRAIAETLAGGPRTQYAIDPTTGAMTATPQPLSTRQIGLAIAMAALTGGISGLGERGPGAEGRAAQDGFKAVQTQNQQADQAAQQTASQDYARQAAVATTNFQTHENAVRLGMLEKQVHDGYVADAAPVLQNLNDVGAVLESGVREGDLLTKYHVTKDMAVVDGTVPRMGGDGTQARNADGSLAWDNTYSVIDPQKKIQLPDDTAQLLASYRIPGYFRMVDGQAQPVNFNGAAGIKAGLVVDGLATASALKITESSVNQQLKTLGKVGDADAQRFEVNLKSSLASGTVTPKALKAYAPFSGMPLDEAFDEMRKAKVDPQLVGQVESLIPADARDAIKQNRVDAAKYSVIDSADKAQAVLAAPGRFTPEQVGAARNFIRIAENDSINKASAEARAHAVATGADLEAMLKTGINPITKERLTLQNAPDSMLVDPNGNVVPQNEQSLYKPTAQQKQTADTARQVLAISADLQAQIARNPALIGPLAGNSAKAFAPFGIGTEAAQKMLDNVSLLQSAVTKMHTGRFSSEILKKSGSLIFPGMNNEQFAGAMDSLKDVAGRYSMEDQLQTVASFRQQQAKQSQSQPPQAPRQVNIPAGAQVGRDAQGNVVGYRLNGTYVPLNGGK
jgi:hypothetical protein